MLIQSSRGLLFVVGRCFRMLYKWSVVVIAGEDLSISGD
jgi:hypothetical protein